MKKKYLKKDQGKDVGTGSKLQNVKHLNTHKNGIN